MAALQRGERQEGGGNGRLADLAASRGPQKITRANKETVVLIALKDLEKMTPGAVDEFFAQAPDGEELAQVLKHLKP